MKEVLQCGDVAKLIKKRKSPDDRPVYYATIEDTDDIICKAHIATGNGSHDMMLKYLGKSMPTSQQMLLNSLGPTALYVKRIGMSQG